MIPFIKKYKFFIITAAAIVAALVIAFAAGNSINEDAAAPDEAPTFSADATSATGPITRKSTQSSTAENTTAKDSDDTTSAATTAPTESVRFADYTTHPCCFCPLKPAAAER